MTKLKQLHNKINSIPVYKNAIQLPIAELSLVIPTMLFSFFYSAVFVVTKPFLSLGINGTGFLLLQSGIIKENVVFIILSFVPVLLKLLCVIGAHKKKKIYIVRQGTVLCLGNKT